ncbi:MAG TPA: ATP-binding cassette domain-containing protein [Conexibacter sp.]|jgi:putative ABC transport system ATP-binding protein
MLLTLEHVAKTNWVGPYEKRTLLDVSLSLSAGDFVGIWGGHRSGKSTLLRIAAGLELPDSGVVRFDGVDLTTLSRAKRGDLRLRAIGLVRGEGPQSAEFDVADFVTLPLLAHHSRREGRTRAMELLRQVGIVECHDVKWRNLSDTERALVSLAHGLVRRPSVLLADDPTAGLDALQQAEVVSLLRATALKTGVAIVMTASSMSALNGVHEAFTLSDGRLQQVREPTVGGRVIEFPSGSQSA